MPSRPLIVLLVLLSWPGWAAEGLGVQLYEQGAYARASRVLKLDVDNPQRSEKERALSRVYLAATLLALGKQAEAQQQLEELARTHPEQTVDPVLFPPALVELDRAVRGKRDAERLRQQAQQVERERLEAEAAVKRERAAQAADRDRAAAEPPTEREPARDSPPPEPEATAPREPGGLRLRPEAVGHADVLGRTLGCGVGLCLGSGPLEVSARALPGPDKRVGLGVEVGYVFGRSMLQPRVALRGTGVGMVGLGGGGVVGLRLTPSRPLTFLLDVGFEHFLVMPDKGYRTSVLTTTAGVGFNLF